MFEITTPRQFRSFVRLILISTIVIVLLLGLFASTPLYSSSTPNLLALVTAQEWASQRITKDVLLMQGSTTQRAEAVNELQIELRYWEQNQSQLKGSFLPPSIDVLFAGSNIDFLAIDTAAQRIVAHPNVPADPIEKQIILDHERSFFLTETQIASALRARQVAETNWLFGISAFLCGGILALLLWLWITIERLLKRYMTLHSTHPVPPLQR